MEIEKYNCLIVDDEPIARKILINYIDQMPFLRVVAERINALHAIDYLRTHGDVNIIFLDINMPNLSGLQLLKIIQPQQPVIFTTAYSEYAVESYELNAVDYLLKPFSFERFTKSVYKAVDALAKPAGSESAGTGEKTIIYIKSDGKTYPVNLDDILYCEARKNYTMVVLKNEQRFMPLVSLSRFETLLLEAGGDFLQAHRSFLIAKKHITALTATSVFVAKSELPIGVQFREKFLLAIGMKGKP